MVEEAKAKGLGASWAPAAPTSGRRRSSEAASSPSIGLDSLEAAGMLQSLQKLPECDSKAASKLLDHLDNQVGKEGRINHIFFNDIFKEDIFMDIFKEDG